MPKNRLCRRHLSKKRISQLSGARSSRKQSDADNLGSETPQPSASARKLLCRSEPLVNEEDDSRSRASQKWLLVHIARLNELVSELVCPKCAGVGLKVIIDSQNLGFCSSVLLECSHCEGDDKYQKSVYTSTRLQEESRGDVAFDVNVRMVLLAHELGMGYAALKKISKVLGIPTLHLKTYQRHDRKVTVAEVDRGLASLQRSREQIRQAYADIDPEVAQLLSEDEEAVINIGVSFDGTWHKRGFTFNYGIGVCIDILTGLVIDYEILSTYCHACALKIIAKREGKLTAEEYDRWRKSHTDCAKNFEGSSKAMEQEAAKRMWARSIRCYQMRYTEMLSDGDSSAFKEVVASNPYPGYTVEKLECINPAHKRMGTALRKISTESRLGGKGLGKLKALKCKALQNFYRGAIINNSGCLDKMKTEIWAGLLHNMSTDERPLHTRCSPAWCWYRQAEESGLPPESHKHHNKNFLAHEVGKKLIPIYHRMSSDSLLKRMQHGGTQNANECLNSVIWSRCPKTVFVGKGRVEAAASMAIATFNEGATAMLSVMEKLWLQTTAITIDTCEEADAVRIAKASRFQSAHIKQRRLTMSNAKKVNRHKQEREEGPTYGAGMAI
ncbi:hypothetical protein WMY93_029857 [Mugilogobius chulae]|uniref:Mutator-like transposase domain-containing protein n=1 Tax=Mugilogobius chulae TaxID=88201 RepID=A0AAW0ML17_9GOBI